MKMYMAAFAIWLRRQRLLIHISEPDEESAQRTKGVGITTDEYARPAFGDFQGTLNSWATSHVVHPANTATVSHCQSSASRIKNLLCCVGVTIGRHTEGSGSVVLPEARRNGTGGTP